MKKEKHELYKHLNDLGVHREKPRKIDHCVCTYIYYTYVCMYKRYKGT